MSDGVGPFRKDHRATHDLVFPPAEETRKVLAPSSLGMRLDSFFATLALSTAAFAALDGHPSRRMLAFATALTLFILAAMYWRAIRIVLRRPAAPLARGTLTDDALVVESEHLRVLWPLRAVEKLEARGKWLIVWRGVEAFVFSRRAVSGADLEPWLRPRLSLKPGPLPDARMQLLLLSILYALSLATLLAEELSRVARREGAQVRQGGSRSVAGTAEKHPVLGNVAFCLDSPLGS